VGCGDGFVSFGLNSWQQTLQVTAVDINLPASLLNELNTRSPAVHFMRELPPTGTYDLLLLLDVIEHVADDAAFLRDLVTRFSPANGRLLLTVPAFQALYGRHDAFLGHYRRYTLAELIDLAGRCGLTVRSSGYLFFSLLLPKLVLFKWCNAGKESDGVGNWRHGRLVTWLLGMVLNMDNRLLLAAGRVGLKIPGLTGWMLCEKQP
jgi:SAM-dependent methyltransferase